MRFPVTFTALLVAALQLILLQATSLRAADREDAEAAAQALAYDQENEGFNIRAESWSRDLQPKLGKATRMQLYKGNEYCFCVAVPKKSGVHITGAVLDLEGKPSGEILPVLDGWGFVLFYKPKKTGMYMIAIHQTEKGKRKEVPVVMVSGYR
ncbi:MAG: hypothetical protein IAE77_18465 [Prosthecobacter sp.]|jgi:hypothetical protein|uniref:hypothetical protein n=1 Tax=Prosthecobacter sp. TaxID=1965333 RepID=UPI0019EFD414|nr:hypothetical protein [Prosthecobacter sp.]MBE2285451.1 hypothetical protein [Prosthecobacter sp.]